MLERFRTFADENYEKCLGCGHYPINNDRVIEWVTAQPAGCAQDFAQLFYTNLRHVSFNEWNNVLGKMASEILVKIKKRNYSKVVLVVDGEIIKSNTWVAVLLFHYIGEYVTDVVNSITANFTGTYSADVLFLHVDDCSYSGEQITKKIRTYRRVIGEATYVIACPFVGTAAYEKLTSVGKWVKFTKSSVIFSSIAQQIENNTTDYGCVDIMNKSMTIFKEPRVQTQSINHFLPFQYDDVVSAIYFDHKLADSISIFNRILATGPVIEATRPRYVAALVGSLINGCESFEYKMYGSIPNKNTSQIGDFDDDGVCPKAFYKTIGYTYNGAVVDKNRNIMSLMEI